jgi:transglutaminase-like putative cysteine protease
VNIRIGYELVYECPQPTPMVLVLNVHYSRASDMVRPDYLMTDPSIPITQFRDAFGNWCTRLVAPRGRVRFTGDGVVRDAGAPDPVVAIAHATPVQDLPEETLPFLLGSRYCETELLSELAWGLFGASLAGWGRVQAICDFVHGHVVFGYEHARPTKTAWETYRERTGVCRDYAHLAVALCRAMNIPARYCTGYLTDIGIPPPYAPMDFAGWFEAFLGGQWHTFDPRNNVPRMGRILVARGRDAADVAISTTFGPNKLESFRVWADQVVS